MLAAKPLPVTVIVVPTGPLVGLKATLGAVVTVVVTVKVAEACTGRPIGKPASIRYVPDGAEGTIRVVEKVPVGAVVTY